MINISFTNNLQNDQIHNYCFFIDNDSNILCDQKSNFLSTEEVETIRKSFSLKYGETKIITQVKNNNIQYIILIGIGEISDLTLIKISDLGGKMCKIMKNNRITTLTSISNVLSAEQNAQLAYGSLLRDYNFDFKTQNNANKNNDVSITFLTENPNVSEEKFNIESKLAEGIFFARNCVNLPPNHLNPETYTEMILDKFKNLENTKVTILGEEKMKKLGMNALLGVGQGSMYSSKLVAIEYKGNLNNQSENNIAIVGKGVTFDTGGISLKPSSDMHLMKGDLGGSAVAIGTILSLSLRKAKVNAVTVVGLVENMPDGNAQRPGDVVQTMSKKTVEILNTDAEGRLVLADAMWYTQENFRPKTMIDVATLTGAIIVALGNTYAGCFSNDNELSNQLCNAGKKVGEELWPMPLHKDYDDDIKSSIADIANLSKKRGAAGSSTAAQFLQHFNNNTRWAHLDIAGVTISNEEKDKSVAGATGFGVSLLDRFIRDNYETNIE